MGEKDNAACPGRNSEIAFKNHFTAGNFDFVESGRRGRGTVGWGCRVYLHDFWYFPK
jgi:hypothetical protein